MPDSKKAPEEEPEQSLRERVNAARYAAYGVAGLVTADGEPDQQALIDQMFPIVVKAVVEKPSDRKDMIVYRPAFMEAIFPDVPNEHSWVEEDDYDLAEGVYKSLDSDIWRLLSVHPDGPIQAMLNGEAGLLLCRTKSNYKRPQGVYVTRNRKCLLEDYSADARKAVERAVNQHEALMALAMGRVPEHAKSFYDEFKRTSKNALDTGQNNLQAALEAAKEDDE